MARKKVIAKWRIYPPELAGLTLTLPGPSAGVSGSLDSYCSLKPLLGHGGSSAGSYLADPTSPIPSHCTVIILFQSVAVHQLS